MPCPLPFTSCNRNGRGARCANFATADSKRSARGPARGGDSGGAFDVVGSRFSRNEAPHEANAFRGQRGRVGRLVLSDARLPRALDGEVLSELTSAASAATISDVLNTRLSVEGQARSRQLYYVLILMLAGPAF